LERRLFLPTAIAYWCVDKEEREKRKRKRREEGKLFFFSFKKGNKCFPKKVTKPKEKKNFFFFTFLFCSFHCSIEGRWSKCQRALIGVCTKKQTAKKESDIRNFIEREPENLIGRVFTEKEIINKHKKNNFPKKGGSLRTQPFSSSARAWMWTTAPLGALAVGTRVVQR